MEYFSTDFTLGILGGGQLGKMILNETRKWDISTKVLDPSTQAPSKLACNRFEQGDLMDFDTVYAFGKDVDVLTIEIENVNVEALEALEKEGKKVYPSSNTLKRIQNKGTQKLFYTDHQIPTAAFNRYAYQTELFNAVQDNVQKLPFVWKSERFGYDGQGVKIVRSMADVQNLPNVPCIAEEWIPFETELAVIVVRNPKGKIASYPVVEMEFHPEANQVEYVLCPARISEAVSKKAIDLAKRTSEAFEHVGLLAVEMFLTKEGEVLVNEVAPRPHNSGHYSIEGSYTNQFEQHLRAILDLPLGQTASKVAAVMVNLVGAENYKGNVVYKGMQDVLKMNGVTPHIYGKKQTRPFRKMGHVTIVNPSIEKARIIAQQVKEQIQVISNE